MVEDQLLQALIFDVDGTLAETEKEGHRVAFNRAFRDGGLVWQWEIEFYGSLLKISGGKERIRYYLEQYQPEFIPPSGQRLEDFIRHLHQVKSRYYHQILSQEPIPLRPGVRRLITEARNKGLRLGIATTATYENAIAVLEHSFAPEVVSWFEVIAAGDIVPQKKPAPDIYRYVLEKMSLSPADCLVFEDSPHGLEASLKAEIPTVVTVNDYTKNGDFTGAITVVSHLGDKNNPCTVIEGQEIQGDYITVETLNLLQKLGHP